MHVTDKKIILINSIEVYYEMLDAKYQSSISSSFREEDFLSFLPLFLCSNFLPPGKASFYARSIK